MFGLCMTPVTKNNLWQKVACDWSHFSLCEWSYSSTFFCRSSCGGISVRWTGGTDVSYWTYGGLLYHTWQYSWRCCVSCMATLDFTGLLHAIFLLCLQDVLTASFYICLYQGFASFAWSVDSWPSVIFAKFGWWWLSGEDHIALMLPARDGRGCFAQPAHICVFVCLSNRSWFMILVNTWHLGYSPCPHLFPGMEVWRKYIAWTNDPRLMAGTEATS